MKLTSDSLNLNRLDHRHVNQFLGFKEILLKPACERVGFNGFRQALEFLPEIATFEANKAVGKGIDLFGGDFAVAPLQE